MDVSNVLAEIIRTLASVLTIADFDKLHSQYFTGRENWKKTLLRGMNLLSVSERQERNHLVQEVAELFARRRLEIRRLVTEAKYARDAVDVTLPGNKTQPGCLHPVSIVMNDLVDIFTAIGFTVYDEGPEIETDYYNFTGLNTPPEHPSRDPSDTFYLPGGLLLRCHTSPGQLRFMETHKPPIKIVCPGKVYRRDDDATHTPMFHQMEGLVIDKRITLCDLQGMLNVLTSKIFAADTKTRLRPSYFPFTEPSVEVDVSCFVCGGEGCTLCKGTGWIEILGAGVVNRKVLSNCGIDPDVYSGLAFGTGIERPAMLKYGVGNIKELYKNDLNIVNQFRLEV